MKKTLLLVAMTAMSTLGANAQWTEPEMPTTASELVSGGKYMVKNVAAAEETNEDACFLAGGTAWYTWSTSTVLSSQEGALIFTITETENGWTLQRTTDNKYTFISGHSPKGLENTGEMHVDQGSQAADLHFFGFTKVGNYYRIYAAQANTAQGINVFNEAGEPALFWGWKTNNEDDGVNPFGPYPTAVYATVDPAQGFGCDWELIGMDQYYAQQNLYAQLTAYEDAGYSFDISSYAKIYEDSNATPEQLNNAANELRKAMKIAETNAIFDGASKDDPRDGTSLIANNDFSAGNINGWTCTFVSGTSAQNIGYQKASYENTAYKYVNHNFEEVYPNCKQFIEAWSNNQDKYKFNGRDYATIGDATLEQTLLCLPQGLYKLSCDAIATQQYNNEVGRNVTGVQLFATDLGEGGLDNYKNIASANGVPEHVEFTFVSTGGDVKLGLRTIDCTANWIAADNFELVYYGPITEDPEKAVLNQIIEQYEEQFGEDYHAGAEAVQAYEEALNAAKNASDNYNEYKDALDKAANDLTASIAAYSTFLRNIETAKDRVNELDGTDWTELAAELSDFVGELENHYDEGDFSVEQIATVAANIEQMINDYVSENLKAGDDVTILLKNPGFTSDFSGWTSTGAGVVWQNNYGNGENIADAAQNIEAPEREDGLAEKWHAAFTLSQTIKNLPAGLYELTCQGFNRHDDGVNDQFAELYAVLPDGSEQTAHFADINAYATEETLFDNTAGEDADPTNYWRSDATVDLEINGDVQTMYIPNSMTGAAWHFMNKSNGEDYDYISKFDIIMTEAGDLTVGARCSDTHQWVIFDNFRIVYKGTGGGIYDGPINDLQKDAQSFIDKVTTPMITEIEDIVAVGDKAIESGEEEACIAAIESLRQVIARAIENMNLQKSVQGNYDVLNGEVATLIAEMEDDELLANRDRLADVIENEEYTEYTNEQMQANLDEVAKFVQDVKDAYVIWQQESKYEELVAATADASDDDPVSITDFLANPDIEAEGSTRGQDPAGWTLDLTQYTNRGYQDNKVYTGATIEVNGEEYTPECSHFIEVWKSGGEAILGDIYQKILLPAGTYKLTADVITTNGEQIQGCYFYAGDVRMEVRSDEANTPKYYEVIFKVKEDRTVVQLGINCSATCNASWLGADNFTLTAYGKNSQLSENGEENAISSINAESLKAIFDLTGRKVSKAQKGLYIIGGKKVVVK